MMPAAESEKTEFELGKILNIDKPKGITSFGVVKKVRSLTHCKKVGHAGTLDPMATGILLICTGKATKQVATFVDMDKEYIGTIHFGEATDTDDADGNVIQKKPVPRLNEKALIPLLNSFIGDIMQIPPMYSAIRQEGKRLYRLARQGKVVERSQRPVTIYDIELLSWNSPDLKIRVTCAKGTYIRSLARDMGEKLESAAHLTALRRTRVGNYRVEDSVSLKDFENSLDAE